ncbi:positive regulator of purine utilization [Metarhizium guizhouense ARSEF 977]|uniref:Positive regulator of purine utilization n=1 Tax=Metarhizium guizhouense (strain ARSEF 977) TaxID=1276136 RepID=A0A0B4IB30_METGA|nr:positive regulator of purine utilization [Metarhizium guizhouense ARSEF 977]
MTSSRGADISSGSPCPRKRPREDSPDQCLPDDDARDSNDTSQSVADGRLGSVAGQSTNFRNISACSRCRSRKNRCDQRLPRCTSCAKVGAACVGYDALTKRELPRSYVFYLENRVEKLEKLLVSHGIAFPPADDLDMPCRGDTNIDETGPSSPGRLGIPDNVDFSLSNRLKPFTSSDNKGNSPKAMSRDSMGSALLNPQTAATFMAVALHTRQTATLDNEKMLKYHIEDPQGFEATRCTTTSLPDKSLALKLVRAYFHRANPQIPILERACFTKIFDRAYSDKGRGLRPREQYLLNMVFAIGCSHGFINEQDKDKAIGAPCVGSNSSESKLSPEEYYSRACMYFDQCIMREKSLEVLQAVLLLASFSLLRPVLPGAWYITGIAMRMAIDLGLHCDTDDAPNRVPNPKEHSQPGVSDRGERVEAEETAQANIREARRRLWWCTYSLDRLVSISAGRPFSISDNDVCTPLPSLDEDDTPKDGETTTSAESQGQQQSYKYLAHHFIKLRLLQSDIYATSRTCKGHASKITTRQETASRSPSEADSDPESKWQWLESMEKRALEWKASAPTTHVTGVIFPKAIFEFYYWQTIMLLYQHDAKIPTLMQEVQSVLDSLHVSAAPAPEADVFTTRRYIKMAQAGQRVLRMYRQRHLAGCIKYTYSSALYLFSVAISYLHAVAQSSAVRARFTPDDVDFTILAARSIFADMADTCPDATRWTEALERTAKATTRITRLYDDLGTGWKEDGVTLAEHGVTSAVSDAQVGGREDGAHAWQTLGGYEDSRPRGNPRYWDFADETTSFRLGGDDAVSALDMAVPPFGSLGPSQALADIESRRGDIESGDLFDLETIWQLDNLATEAPHICRVLNVGASAVETGQG